MVVPGGQTYDSPVPPAGTVVHALEVSGGGLQARMSVKSSFTWQAGKLDDGLDLGQARIHVLGRGGQATGGNIEILTIGTLTETDLGMSGGARLTNSGLLSTTGNVRLWWVAGGNPVLSNVGTLSVDLGALVLDDLIVLLEGTLTIAPGAIASLRGSTVPTFMVGKALVRGGGTLEVASGGRLYAADTARVLSGTTLLLGPNGTIADKRAPVLYPGLVTDPGKQQLVVQGPFQWTGGTIEGDVLLSGTAVLNVIGPDNHLHANGTVLLAGSGVVNGSATLQVDQGQLSVSGDLLLQSPLVIDRGRGWSLDIRGKLRIGGPATVKLGDFPLDNRGVITVEEGTLHLAQLASPLTQHSTGSLSLAPGTTVRVEQQLRIDGSVTGSGRIQGDLAPLGTLRPGNAAQRGTLDIDGSLQLDAKSTTRLALQGPADYSRVHVTGQVFAAGTLRVEAPGYVPAAADRYDIVTGGAGTLTAGRYARVQLPAAVNDRYLRLTYDGANVVLKTAVSVPGFDLKDPPPLADLAAWVAASPYRWVGYYLKAPCHSASWMGKRAFLTGLGLGVGIFYVGQQTAGASPCIHHDTTAGHGRIDAADAIASCASEGFAPGSWIYLDVEVNPAGAPEAGMLAYVRSWVESLLQDGTFNPGLYVHHRELAALDAVVTSAFQAAGRPDRARYWCVGGPPTSALTDPPARCGVPEATVWQQRNNFDESFGGHTLHIDRSVCVLPDPSTP
ncbi:glycoside hydrolase domain-containing protein [Streptomyces sp. TLI_185]|uniref:glycoside hydrolase domain-containing protein n=1 Tax=Streptomyces sp. TLI_185 TaxID=2485151 RepID=UPI00161D4E9A|nr:glycoside hydrolase domain-containing protein [Streptomyces sp. TLI_185]